MILNKELGYILTWETTEMLEVHKKTRDEEKVILKEHEVVAISSLEIKENVSNPISIMLNTKNMNFNQAYNLFSEINTILKHNGKCLMFKIEPIFKKTIINLLINIESKE